MKLPKIRLIYKKDDFVVLKERFPQPIQNIALILDRDPMFKNYLIASLVDIGRRGGDLDAIYRSESYWVEQHQILRKVEFKKSYKKQYKILLGSLSILLIGLITYLICQ